MSNNKSKDAANSGAERRAHERFALAVQAAVTIPQHPTRDFGVCEFSETGMFLAFIGAQLNRQSLENNGIQAGSELKVTFSVPVGGRKSTCDLDATIVRMTDHGIGVAFLPERPEQLLALIDAFAAAQQSKDQSVG